MSELGKKISESKHRPQIDEYLNGGMSPKKVARYMAAEHGETFNEKTIKDYRDNIFRKKDGPIGAIVQVTRNLADNELPATSERELMSRHFSFRSTNADLELIYDRIRTLKISAITFPFDDTYDKRIATYLAQAEGIRTRVFRYQYENIRRAVLLNIGKKIVTAAISVFLPYVVPGKRKEVVGRFQSMVAPLLGLPAVPEEPKDIKDLKESSDAKK